MQRRSRSEEAGAIAVLATSTNVRSFKRPRKARPEPVCRQAGGVRGTPRKKGSKQMSNELVKQISYILYKANKEDVKVNALLKDESIWLTQKSMAELFDCSPDNIGLHLKNIFASGELEKSSVTEESSATASDGKNYKMTFYNLYAIISVGYRVNSAKAKKFRIWATNVLKEYIKKGFVLDDERLSRAKIFLQNVPLIMIKTLKLQSRFMSLFRISFILQLPCRIFTVKKQPSAPTPPVAFTRGLALASPRM